MSGFRWMSGAFSPTMLFVFLMMAHTAEIARADSCQFILGFDKLATVVPKTIGRCLDNEQHNPLNGDGLQHTSSGLLVWRKSDNVAAFTNGYFTILDGPHGYEERLNTQRFSWEANPQSLPVVGYQPAGPAQLVQQPGQSLWFTEFTLGNVHEPLIIGLSGSGFAPGEAVILQGILIPNQITNTFTGPIPNPILTPVPLGPVEATADNRGSLTAGIKNTENPEQGGQVDIQATGQQSGRTISTNGFAGP